MEERLVVGSEEWCALPELGIAMIKARVDSGAKTSSLHAFNIEVVEKGGGRFVEFEVHPLQENREVVCRCRAPLVDERRVRSSSGVAEKRYVISTTVKLGDATWNIELTLNNRTAMEYRMLLGRQALKGRVLIDPGASCLLGEAACV